MKLPPGMTIKPRPPQAPGQGPAQGKPQPPQR